MWALVPTCPVLPFFFLFFVKANKTSTIISPVWEDGLQSACAVSIIDHFPTERGEANTHTQRGKHTRESRLFKRTTQAPCVPADAWQHFPLLCTQLQRLARRMTKRCPQAIFPNPLPPPKKSDRSPEIRIVRSSKTVGLRFRNNLGERRPSLGKLLREELARRRMGEKARASQEGVFPRRVWERRGGGTAFPPSPTLEGSSPVRRANSKRLRMLAEGGMLIPGLLAAALLLLPAILLHSLTAGTPLVSYTFCTPACHSQNAASSRGGGSSGSRPGDAHSFRRHPS